METGTLSSETLVSALRVAAQRRKQGTLFIGTLEKGLSIHFVQGKIVEVQATDRRASEEVLDVLKQAALVPSEGVYAAQGNYAGLFQTVRGCTPASPLDLALFRAAIKKRVLDRLYSLNQLSGMPFEFRVRSVDVESDFAPMISVPQLLLEMAAYGEERKQLEAEVSPSAIVERGEEFGGEKLTDEELLLLRALDAPRSREDLERRALLSRYHFGSALLGLIERDLVARHNGASDKRYPAPVPDSKPAPLTAPPAEGRRSLLKRVRPAGAKNAAAPEKLALVDEANSPAVAKAPLTLRILQSSALLRVLSVVIFALAVAILPILFWRPFLWAF